MKNVKLLLCSLLKYINIFLCFIKYMQMSKLLLSLWTRTWFVVGVAFIKERNLTPWGAVGSWCFTSPNWNKIWKQKNYTYFGSKMLKDHLSLFWNKLFFGYSGENTINKAGVDGGFYSWGPIFWKLKKLFLQFLLYFCKK